MGKLSLEGSLQWKEGVLAFALFTKREGLRGLILPVETVLGFAATGGHNVIKREYPEMISGSCGNKRIRKI